MTAETMTATEVTRWLASISAPPRMISALQGVEGRDLVDIRDEWSDSVGALGLTEFQARAFLRKFNKLCDDGYNEDVQSVPINPSSSSRSAEQLQHTARTHRRNTHTRSTGGRRV
jgi:hypothetical protein